MVLDFGREGRLCPLRPTSSASPQRSPSCSDPEKLDPDPAPRVRGLAADVPLPKGQTFSCEQGCFLGRLHPQRL